MSENLKEIYEGKKFIFIEGAKKEKLGFVKGQDMSCQLLPPSQQVDYGRSLKTLTSRNNRKKGFFSH